MCWLCSFCYDVTFIEIVLIKNLNFSFQESRRTIVKSLVDFSLSDFAQVVKTRSFVDKTLLIKDIFDAPLRIAITAPPKYGKSTNLDMIKRFLEIEVDEWSTRKHIKSTTNYSLFTENELKICEDANFFKEHFGKHPVIHIDFELLDGVRDFAHALEVFRTITRKTFLMHNYLLATDGHTCWSKGFSFADFENHTSTQKNRCLDEHNLKESFENLSMVLFEFFKKEAFVLIDNYDAFLKGVLSEDIPESEAIISFINTTIDNLLNNNRYVGRALLTGVIPITGSGVNYNRWQVEHYLVWSDYPSCQYFGLTYDEFVGVVTKLNLDSDMLYRFNITNVISYFHDVRSCIFDWSDLQLFYRIDDSHETSHRRHIDFLKPYLRNLPIRNEVLNLLYGKNYKTDTRPISTADILLLKNKAYAPLDKFFHLLYYFGYLTHVSSASGILHMASESRRCRLANIYFESFPLYNVEQKAAAMNIWKVLRRFTCLDYRAEVLMQEFGSVVYAWYQRKLSDHLTPDLHSSLFVSLISQVNSIYYGVIFDKSIFLSIPSGFGSQNESYVEILITTKYVTAGDRKQGTLDIAREFFATVDYFGKKGCRLLIVIGHYDCGMCIVYITDGTTDENFYDMAKIKSFGQ